MPRVVSSRQAYRTAAWQYARDSVALDLDRIRSWPVSGCAPLRFSDSCDGAAAAEACEDNEAGDSHDGSALAYVAAGSKDRFVLARVASTSRLSSCDTGASRVVATSEISVVGTQGICPAGRDGIASESATRVSPSPSATSPT
jgi:hypothetical protein